MPKKSQPAKRPLYKQKPPQKPVGRVSPRAEEDFVHAHPISTAPFELREDGTVATVYDRRKEKEERRSQSAAIMPQLTFHSDNPFIRLYHGNCLELLDAIAAKYPEGRFDTIFADPPYFLSNGGISCHAGKMVKVDKGDWDKSRGPELNHEFNTEWLARCQRVLKPNGTIWVSGTHHVIFSIGYAMQQLGYKILNDIAWEKPNPPPNLSCRYFTHSTETILWAAKNEKSKHVFNYADMRKVTGKQMKTVWRETEFPITEAELNRRHKDSNPRYGSSKSETDISSVWTMTAPSGDEKEHGKHPTQKPVALIERCLLASTNEGDLVLDPFLGGGTTAIAAIKLNRGAVGIELDEAHAKLSMKRIKTALDQNTDLFTPPPPKLNEIQFFIFGWVYFKRNRFRRFIRREQTHFAQWRCAVKAGGFGGGNTLTGLNFEKEIDFQDLLALKPGYEIKAIPGLAGKGVFFNGKLVARSFRKHSFYSFLDEQKVNWKPLISKRLLPDDALLVIVRETLFIIEVKYQQVAGSVDEKLQTCDFKRKQYLKLVTPLGLKVEYVYVLSEWFRDPCYKDVLDYIQSVNCHYKFGSLPLAWLGLPEPVASSAVVIPEPAQ